MTATKSVLDVSFQDAAGKTRTLRKYQGDVLLIVNTASYWGHTPQHGVLQVLQDRYGPRGLRVLGFPCNDFAAEEPDDLETIKAFCAREFGASYELFNKVHIREGTGHEVHPLYRQLTEATAPGVTPGPVSWNFEKFLIDRQGNVIGRWSPKTQPDDPAVVRAIEAALEGTHPARP